jgi:DnaJ family protein C protein 3
MTSTLCSSICCHLLCPFFLCLLLCTLVHCEERTADDFKRLADNMLLIKEYDKAEAFYTRAIDLEPQNFRAYYGRAALFLVKTKYREALADLNEALNLNSDFTGALIRRAELYSDLGRFECAKEDIHRVLKLKPGHSKAKKILEKIFGIEEEISAGLKAMNSADYSTAYIHFTSVLSRASQIQFVLLERAKAAIELKYYRIVLEDTLKVLKQQPNHLNAIYLRSKAFLYIGDTEACLRHLEACLRFDPHFEICKNDRERLMNFQRSLRAAEHFIQQRKGHEAITELNRCFAYDPQYDVVKPRLYLLKCKAFVTTKDGPNALEACDKAIALDNTNVDAYLEKGEAQILLSDYDNALKSFQKVFEVERFNAAANDGIRRVLRLQKMANRKDLYKILGVSKTASSVEIKRAYRKLAVKHHPDKNKDNPEAAKMFSDISNAYIILSDPEKRDRYDRGDDLTEPPQQSQYYASPFGGFTLTFGDNKWGFGPR